MRKAHVFMNGIVAGLLEELLDKTYRFTYLPEYDGAPISLTMPLKNSVYTYNKFPAFFEGVLPEGRMLEALLQQSKLNREDHFGQLIIVGKDLVGAVTVEEIK